MDGEIPLLQIYIEEINTEEMKMLILALFMTSENLKQSGYSKSGRYIQSLLRI